MAESEEPNKICPMCSEKGLQLSEIEREIPYFGKVYMFSMTCPKCKYHLADIEAAEQKEPSKYTFEISSEEDMKVRIVKSSRATIKLPNITAITPGPASQGYISNIEGVLNRVKHEVETLRDMEEDDEAKKKCKNMLKKILRITWGQEKQKIIIEDPGGNSAIISDKAVKEAFKPSRSD